jgi:hypothetical protein
MNRCALKNGKTRPVHSAIALNVATANVGDTETHISGMAALAQKFAISLGFLFCPDSLQKGRQLLRL